MGSTFRRIVTGTNAEGRSVVVEDTDVVETGQAGNFDFWMTGTGGSAGAAVPFFPPEGGTIFRVFRIPPQSPAMSAADIAAMADGFFAELGDPACRVDTTRHPLMHRTPTTDYIMLLSGSAALLLDEGEPVPLAPFNAVVQRGTNHMWLNTGREDAVFLAVMVGAAS